MSYLSLRAAALAAWWLVVAACSGHDEIQERQSAIHKPSSDTLATEPALANVVALYGTAKKNDGACPTTIDEVAEIVNVEKIPVFLGTATLMGPTRSSLLTSAHVIAAYENEANISCICLAANQHPELVFCSEKDDTHMYKDPSYFTHDIGEVIPLSGWYDKGLVVWPTQFQNIKLQDGTPALTNLLDVSLKTYDASQDYKIAGATYNAGENQPYDRQTTFTRALDDGDLVDPRVEFELAGAPLRIFSYDQLDEPSFLCLTELGTFVQHGDSGGPLFTTRDGVIEVIGTLSNVDTILVGNNELFCITRRVLDERLSRYVDRVFYYLRDQKKVTDFSNIYASESTYTNVLAWRREFLELAYCESASCMLKTQPY